MDANDHLVIARKYLDDAGDMPDDPLAAMMHIHRYTSHAGDHIDAARQLDPTASIVVDGSRWTVNRLICQALHMQGMVDTRHGPTKKDVRRGIEALEKAQRYGANTPRLYTSLAIAQIRLNNSKGAKQYLDKAIELDPTDKEAHELKDGAKGAMPAADEWWVEYLIEMAKDWKFWLLAAGFCWWIYCGYRVVTGLNSGNDPDIAFYFLWFVGVVAAWASFEWVKGKLGY